MKNMKKLLFITFITFFISCEKEDCEGKAQELTNKYNEAMFYNAGNTDVILKLTAEYNQKLKDIYQDCD